MVSLSKKSGELIIILLALTLLIITWMWYGEQLKEIDQKKTEFNHNKT